MKYLPTFFAVLVLGLAAPVFTQAATPPAAGAPAPRVPKNLPPNIKAELEAAIAKVPKDNGKALAKIVARISKKYSDFSPEIVGDAVGIVAAALRGQPDVAAVVIPQIVAAAAKANPTLSGPIVAAALSALPSSMKASLIAPITQAAIAAVPEKKEKAAALNAAFQAAGEDPAVVKALDQVAADNKIGIIPEGATNADASIRYFVDDQLGNTDSTGDQGTISQGATTGSGATTGGGSGGGSGSPATSPTPSPAPTVIP